MQDEFSSGKYSRIFSYASSFKVHFACDTWIVYNESDIGNPIFLDISSNYFNPKYVALEC